MLGLSWLEKYLCRHARRIITPLPAADDYIVACCGVPRERVVWIPNGVDLSLAPEPAPVAERDCLQVVYAGAHGEANGLGTVLETARLLREQGWEHRFLFRLLGDGQEKLGLQRLAEEWDLSNVVFEHPVPKVEIPDLLSGADIGLLHLRNFPTFMWGISPNKLFDYMAAARPVVCAVTTKDDPVSLAQAGLTVDSEDPAALAAALQRLADLSPQERWEMGLRGRRYVEEHHSFATLSRQFEELLLEVVAEAS
jgi:glycosyltransferase involved in cell wall biosynthesis